MAITPRAKVLIVDDDDGLRTLIARLLARHQYETCEASEGTAALRLIAEGDIDIVLLDLTLPGLSGDEVLRHLRRLALPPHVIVVSGQGSLESRVRSLYGGAADYLTKPFEPEELLARLTAAMRQRWDLEDARTSARTDAMTGLANRAAFEDALARETKRALRQKRPMALLYLDADGLKGVNDAYGHDSGDELLRLIAHALSGACRETDVAARTGGDEFAVILPETRRADAAAFAQRLRKNLGAARVELASGGSLTVSVSIGLAVLGEDAVDAAGLRQAADAALYADKAGRPRTRR